MLIFYMNVALPLNTMKADKTRFDNKDIVHYGTLQAFNDEKGTGLIKEINSTESYKVQKSSMRENLRINDHVMFYVTYLEGERIAVNVRKIISPPGLN